MDNCCMSVLSETQLRSDEGQCTIRCLDISSKYSLHGEGYISKRNMYYRILENLWPIY